MIVKTTAKLVAALSPLLVIGYLVPHFLNTPSEPPPQAAVPWIKHTDTSDSNPLAVIPPSHMLVIDDDGKPVIDTAVYRPLHSNSTATGDYFKVFLGGKQGYNPSFVPHPLKYDSWLVIAKQVQTHELGHIHEQLMCTAGFLNDVLVCNADPTIIAIEKTVGHCEGDKASFNFGQGPRDARVFHGPTAPYILYGSLSGYTCLGVFVQDARMLVDEFRLEAVLVNDFKQGTEIQRPPPYAELEKNFFLFWDSKGDLYVHYDLHPKRVFAKLLPDGSVGPDLAPLAASQDEMCLQNYLPQLPAQNAFIHQATNALSITLCRRADPNCKPDDSNTFVMHIFHYKTFFDWHGGYEPYVILFQQTAPFAVHSISSKPYWLSGRTRFTKDTGAVLWEGRNDLPENHSEMFYVTSISWKTHGQRYHGYIDDPIFVGFGIEDSRSGGMDVIAEDLLQDLNFC